MSMKSASMAKANGMKSSSKVSSEMDLEMVSNKVLEMEKLLVARFQEALNRDNNIQKTLDIIQSDIATMKELTKEIFKRLSELKPQESNISKPAKAISNDIQKAIDKASDIAALKNIAEENEIFQGYIIFGRGVQFEKAKATMLNILNKDKVSETPTKDKIEVICETYKLNRKAYLSLLDEAKECIKDEILNDEGIISYIKKTLNHDNLGKEVFEHIASFAK